MVHVGSTENVDEKEGKPHDEIDRVDNTQDKEGLLDPPYGCVVIIAGAVRGAAVSTVAVGGHHAAVMLFDLKQGGPEGQGGDANETGTWDEESEHGGGDGVAREQFNIAHRAHVQVVLDAEAICAPFEEQRKNDAEGNDPGCRDEAEDDGTAHLPRVLAGEADEHTSVDVDGN